jgi:hypothetical protein
MELIFALIISLNLVKTPIWFLLENGSTVFQFTQVTNAGCMPSKNSMYGVDSGVNMS